MEKPTSRTSIDKSTAVMVVQVFFVLSDVELDQSWSEYHERRDKKSIKAETGAASENKIADGGQTQGWIIFTHQNIDTVMTWIPKIDDKRYHSIPLRSASY
ncbi:hypothetical protein BGZ94_005908 [Podila epigama]|nr:hypothetical protein BGZ94_005908 [Podila epigama]